jgi:Putative MetA-pathway of phenol degradation
LPFGQAEIEPFFSYTREEDDMPVLFADGGSIGSGNQEVRRNEFLSGQTLRVGLPFDSQLELSLPYRYVQQSVTTPVGFGQREHEDGSGHGLGDLRVGLAKTLLRENGGWWPDLVARVNWDADTGQTTDNDVVLGGGFNELSGSLSAIKRQDPLAFVGSVSYEKAFENNNVEPGDELGFSIGTFLAASPSTSLRLALAQSFIDNSRIDGEGINGSDGVAATATFGASVILGRGVLLDVAADIGLTDDAPDYAVRTSLPIRFNLPVY